MEKYLECHGTKMYLKEMTPEIEFLFEIFGDDFRTKNWILHNQKNDRYIDGKRQKYN